MERRKKRLSYIAEDNTWFDSSVSFADRLFTYQSWLFWHSGLFQGVVEDEEGWKEVSKSLLYLSKCAYGSSGFADGIVQHILPLVKGLIRANWAQNCRTTMQGSWTRRFRELLRLQATSLGRPSYPPCLPPERGSLQDQDDSIVAMQTILK